MWAQVHQQRGYSGKMVGGQLKRAGPPLGEHSVIQHTTLTSLHPASRQIREDCPSPSKRMKRSEQQLSVHTLPPKPAFWNPLHKDSSTWDPQTSERKNPPPDFQESNKQRMGNYTPKSSAAPSTRTHSSPGVYKQGCGPQFQKDKMEQHSYSSPRAKPRVPSCNSLEPQRGGQGGNQATSPMASTPSRGSRDQYIHGQSSPANPPSTSSSSSVPYSHLGQQRPPPPLPSPLSCPSVPQQHHNGSREAWRYHSGTSPQSLESGAHTPSGLLPQRLQSHTQPVDSVVPLPFQRHHSGPPLPPSSSRTPVITANLPLSQPPCSVSTNSCAASSIVTTSSPRGGPVYDGSSWSSSTSSLSAVQQTLCQREQASAGPKPYNQRLSGPPQLESSKPPPLNAERPYYDQTESTCLFLSGLQRSGDSVITRTASNPLPSIPESNPDPPRLGLQPGCASSQPYSQSIEEALDKLDAELEGHMQAEERRKRDREEEEQKKREQERKRQEWQEKQRRQEEERRKVRVKEEEERKKQEEEERKRREWEQQKRRQQDEERLSGGEGQ